jgi:hypothetical protein
MRDLPKLFEQMVAYSFSPPVGVGLQDGIADRLLCGVGLLRFVSADNVQSAATKVQCLKKTTT